jgi:hypothetical protein
MAKMIKFLLLGAIVGGAVAAMKSRNDQQASAELPKKAATSAGAGALAGGFLGFVLSLRSRRKLRRATRLTADVAQVVAPVVELKGRRARRAAVKAARRQKLAS